MKNATFSCQNVCLDFLVENKFDFNKLIRDGITYMNGNEEEELRERMKPKAQDKFEKLDLSTVDKKSMQTLEDTK